MRDKVPAVSRETAGASPQLADDLFRGTARFGQVVLPPVVHHTMRRLTLSRKLDPFGGGR